MWCRWCGVGGVVVSDVVVGGVVVDGVVVGSVVDSVVVGGVVEAVWYNHRTRTDCASRDTPTHSPTHPHPPTHPHLSHTLSRPLSHLTP